MLAMAFRGRKLLAVLLALAAATPSLPAFSQVRSAPVEIPAVLPSGLGGAASAPAFSASALGAPALTAAPSASLPAGVSAPLAAAPVPVAAPVSTAVLPAAAPALRAAPAASDGPKEKSPSAESSKAAADELFDASAPAPAADDAVAAPAVPRHAPALDSYGPSAMSHPAASQYDPGHTPAPVQDQVRDRVRYFKLLSRSFWWYMFTHISDSADPKMWPGHKERWRKAAAAGPVSVSRPRAFFVSMRVTGMSGRFYALGGSALEDDLVIEEFRGAFDRFFDGPGIGAREREAFERFMARAKGFNAEKRAHTNMYKNIRDPLLKASTMRPDEIAAYFDSLLPPQKENAIRDFQQSGRMEHIREQFMRVLRRTLDEEDPNDPNRVRAAIVLGSFATGSAGPGSDFDVEALVNGASNKNLPAFTRRLIDRWTEAGFHQTNPVTVHDNASWPSWGLVNIVQTRHYIVISNEPALEARLSRQAYENPAVQLERGYTLRGRVNRAAQYAIVGAATLIHDAKTALGFKPTASIR